MKNPLMAAILVAMFVLLLSGIVSAQVGGPGDYPQQFYGYVTINGAPAPDRMLISAKFEGKDVGGTLTSGGNYNLIINMKEQDEGKAIYFYVQNVNINIQSVYQSGGSVKLDLSANIAAPPASGGSTGGSSGGSGGSSGGSTGGSSGSSGTCTESWICTDWLDCTNGIQKRVCADVNRCNTTVSKPAERQDCVVPKVCEPGSTKCENGVVSTCSGLGTTWLESQICEAGCNGNVCKQAQAGSAELSAQGANPLSGMLTLEDSWPYWIVVIVVIVILAWFFLFRKKGKPADEKK